MFEWQKQPLETFCKKRVALKNLAKFTEKHMCQSLLFNKVAGLKKQTLAQVFSCEFCEIFKNIYSEEYLWWLLLNEFWTHVWVAFLVLKF